MAPKTSTVWEFLIQISDEKAKCLFCKAVLSCKGSSTSNLNKHLKRHPGAHHTQSQQPKQPQSSEAVTADVVMVDVDDPMGSASMAVDVDAPDVAVSAVAAENLRYGQSTLAGYFRRPMTAQQKQKHDMLLLKMVVWDLHPFSIVEDNGFREFVASLAPTSLPSRATLTRALEVQHDDMVARVTEELKGVIHVLLTTDIWTSRTTQAYIAITAYFIRKDWTMGTVLLGCLAITGSHTGPRIRDELVKVSKQTSI